MDRQRMSLTIAGLASVGVVLLAYESVQTLRGELLGALGTTLLFVGLAAAVVAGALLIALLNAPSGSATALPAGTESMVDSDS